MAILCYLLLIFAVYFPPSVYCSKQKINLFLNSKYFVVIFLLNFEVILFTTVSQLKYLKLATKYVIINYILCLVNCPLLVALVDETGA